MLDLTISFCLTKFIQAHTKLTGKWYRLVKSITREELKKKMDQGDEFILLDVRDTPEYNAEHISGAVHMLISNFDQKAHSVLRKTDTIITYSEDFNCPASTIAAEKLEKMGYKKVLDYKGSFKDWKAAGYPTVT